MPFSALKDPDSAWFDLFFVLFVLAVAGGVTVADLQARQAAGLPQDWDLPVAASQGRRR